MSTKRGAVMGGKREAGQVKALETEATGPLRGIRIVDLTSVVNGSYAMQILADQGADVIKVEDPSGGDMSRASGRLPPGAPRDMGPIFLTINRNKRSVTLDLKLDSGRRRLRRLIQSCDVFAASIRYDALKRLGLSYEEVAAIRPDVIYVHTSGYGSGGPYAGRPAYDDLIQAASGMADVWARTHGEPAPRFLPTVIADKVTGLFMAQAVTAALVHRGRTGEGQFVEVPMLECVTGFLMVEHLFEQIFDPPVGQYGYTRIVNPNRKPHATKDGYVCILPYTDKNWEQFFAVAGFGDAVRTDPRFEAYRAGARDVEQLYGLVEEIAATKTTQEWIDLLTPLSIPVAKANRLEELESDPHLRAVELFQRFDHPDVGVYKQLRPPVLFGRTPSNIRRHPPRLGEHSAEVLDALGADDADA